MGKRSLAISLLPMPKLSPSQSAVGVGTKLIKWHVKENSVIETYALICEVETDALTDDTSCGDIYRLEVEIQEDCYIAKLLCKEGDYIQAGFPIAICCDDEEELELAQATGLIDTQQDAYEHSRYTLVGFQSYTKSVVKAS
jgi:pyruvate/2-oxoglutarate dehydrogenase complex dihydrolipoamide acyltransferase (E2) component